MAAWGFKENEPQINADERRSSPVTGFLDNPGYASHPATDFGVAHRKVRKERKVQPKYGTRMTRIGRIITDTTNPRACAQSAFYHVCSSLNNPASGASVSAFICVHLRFFKNMVFQTGLTGSTGYISNHVIMSNFKCQLSSQEIIRSGGYNG